MPDLDSEDDMYGPPPLPLSGLAIYANELPTVWHSKHSAVYCEIGGGREPIAEHTEGAENECTATSEEAKTFIRTSFGKHNGYFSNLHVLSSAHNSWQAAEL